MAFSAKYIDHFSNPRGVGEVDQPDLMAEVEHEGGGCFDNVRLTLKVENGLVADARFRARACSGTIAACSALVELVTGKNLEDARAISAIGLISYLDGIPEKKQHSVELAVQALQVALATDLTPKNLA